VRYGQPATNLEHVPQLEHVLQGIHRPYMKDVTHLYGWKLFLLANHLKDLIECPKLPPNGTCPANNIHSKCKLDHFYHLYKRWNDGNFYRAQEADTGFAGKSSIQEDTVHVL